MDRPKKKIDICVVADHSVSLASVGETINNSLVSMLEEIKKTPYLYGCEVYLSLISFNDGMTKVIDFEPIDKVSPSSLKLEYEGLTNCQEYDSKHQCKMIVYTLQS